MVVGWKLGLLLVGLGSFACGPSVLDPVSDGDDDDGDDDIEGMTSGGSGGSDTPPPATTGSGASADGSSDGSSGDLPPATTSGTGDEPADTGSDSDSEGGSDPDPPPSEPGIEAELCPAVAAESRYCLVATPSSGLTLVGLDSGSHCPIAATSIFDNNESLAWIGDAVYACAGGAIERIDLATGQTTEGALPCTAVTSSGADEVYYLAGGALESFFVAPDIESMMDGAPGLNTGINPHGRRLGGDPSLLWVSWHSTEELGRYDPDLGELAPLPLEGHDGWVFGVGRVDGEVVIARHTPNVGFDHELAFYDATDGTMNGAVSLNPLSSVTGIACRSPAP